MFTSTPLRYFRVPPGVHVAQVEDCLPKGLRTIFIIAIMWHSFIHLMHKTYSTSQHTKTGIVLKECMRFYAVYVWRGICYLNYDVPPLTHKWTAVTLWNKTYLLLFIYLYSYFVCFVLLVLILWKNSGEYAKYVHVHALRDDGNLRVSWVHLWEVCGLWHLAVLQLLLRNLSI
jgi:hypothetical protein